MKLSVILPTIRRERLAKLYESFEKSYSGTWELIAVSPYELPDELKGKGNIKYIQDWGNPVRCQQIGLIEARGEYVHRAVDDSLYLPGAMDKAFELVTGDSKTIVATKYTESNATVDRNHAAFQNMKSADFYNLTYHHQTLKPYVPAHFKMLNFGIIDRYQLLAVGGWDCQFESVAIAELDLAIRLQFHGCQIVLTDDIVLECDWMPGHEGDHGPMHDAFAPDMEKYTEIYSRPDCEDRVILDITNWMSSPDKWERRFGK
jgi:glycosyltransferase involved in cell wall biosynthesis